MKSKCEIGRKGFVGEKPHFCVLSTLEVKYVEYMDYLGAELLRILLNKTARSFVIPSWK